MTQPAPSQPVYVGGRSPWWLPRFLFFAAALCELFAAIVFSSSTVIVTHSGWAWLAGGLSAAALAMAVP
jgi:hypothetical protein